MIGPDNAVVGPLVARVWRLLVARPLRVARPTRPWGVRASSPGGGRLWKGRRRYRAFHNRPSTGNATLWATAGTAVPPSSPPQTSATPVVRATSPWSC